MKNNISQKFLLYFLSLLMIMTSCKKKNRDVTVHGQVLYFCNQQPAANIHVNISTESGNESTHVGSAYTNNNGYYSVKGEVGSFDTWSMSGYGQNLEPSGNIVTHDDDILINGLVFKNEQLNIHIKNANPYDGADYFTGLEWCDSLMIRCTPMNLNQNYLYGNIDSTFSIELPDKTYYILHYTTRKNSVISGHYSPVTTDCYNITNVDLFY